MVSAKEYIKKLIIENVNRFIDKLDEESAEYILKRGYHLSILFSIRRWVGFIVEYEGIKILMKKYGKNNVKIKSNRSFDVICNNENETVFIEIKGSTTPGHVYRKFKKFLKFIENNDNIRKLFINGKSKYVILILRRNDKIVLDLTDYVVKAIENNSRYNRTRVYREVRKYIEEYIR